MKRMASQSDRPIFVIGCPRSGTTLLQLMLHSHERIAIPAETRFLLQAYASRHRFGDLHVPDNRRALAEWIVRRRETKFHDLGLDPDEVIEEIVAGPPTLGSALGIVFRAYARRFGKPRWGDKRPSYFKHVDVLRRMWPDAQFIHLIRDGRDCVASLKEMPWYNLGSYHAICAWREAIDYGRRYARKLGPDTYYELQYEHLVADPAGELAKLCKFLGEDFDPRMTRPQEIAKLTVPPNKRWHERTQSDITTGRVGSWAHRLEPWEIALAEKALGSRLRAYGYEVSGSERPSMTHMLRLARVAVRRKTTQRRRALRDRLARRNEPGPVECRLNRSGDSERATA
ncbi:sulfotransferase [Thermomonospora curvata DSM 43183]|uniref:Sulfotransferase n=2 Tax=Thermomonospora curvata TaxID=2020 RepID=D1A5N0_THECD|nr:sulfotransferase [Thermomonospora curvata DSM 43183]